MAVNRGLVGAGTQRSRNNGRCHPFAIFIFISLLAFSLFFVARGIFTATSTVQNEFFTSFGGQDLNWRLRLALQHLKSLLSKEVIEVIKASADDLGPLSVDFFRKNNLSASWKYVGRETATENNATSTESSEVASDTIQQKSRGRQEFPSNEEHSSIFETPALLARRQLREKRREKRAAYLLNQDNEVIVKLENAAIKHSKSVDSAVLGKYNIWRKEYENGNSDSIVRLMRDQMIMARVYISLAGMKHKLELSHELQTQLKESQRALGEATADSDLQPWALEKMKAMGQVLSKAREKLYDCKLITGKLRAMLHSADELVQSLKIQSTFLSQLAAKTIPNGLHCLSLRLTIDYYLLPIEKRKVPQSENLENPNLYHYALFSDNVLAASVVVNSTIMNAKDPEKHVFHLVTDKLNFGAMNMWFLLNPPGKATIHVENVDEFKWLNSSYCPVLFQLESSAMKEYYFKEAQPTTLSAADSNLKYRNPKYLSMLNHLRFYLPQVYPKLDKILFLDDDIVVRKDLTGLWTVDLHGKVNGAVETCGVEEEGYNWHIPQMAEYGDAQVLTSHAKQNCHAKISDGSKFDNGDRILWQLGTLPPGLITFYGLTYPLEKSWHVLGLGYNPSIDRSELEKAAVVHYNGNMKPWLELAIMKYRSYWTKYVKSDHPYMRYCKLSE